MNAKIIQKFKCKGWFGRDKFYFLLQDKYGQQYTYNCRASEYILFKVGDFVETP